MRIGIVLLERRVRTHVNKKLKSATEGKVQADIEVLAVRPVDEVEFCGGEQYPHTTEKVRVAGPKPLVQRVVDRPGSKVVGLGPSDGAAVARHMDEIFDASMQGQELDTTS